MYEIVSLTSGEEYTDVTNDQKHLS